MARTKETARKPTGGKPCIQLAIKVSFHTAQRVLLRVLKLQEWLYIKMNPFHVQLTCIVTYQTRANLSLHFITFYLSHLKFKSAPTFPPAQRAFHGVLKV